MEATKQKRCDECIHYEKISKKYGECVKNAIDLTCKPLHNKDNKPYVVFITVKGSDYCELHSNEKASD